MPNKHGQPVIAIDGPSAAGKSSISKEIAYHYGALHLEAGIFFRMITQAMLEQGFDPNKGPLNSVQQQRALAYAETIDWKAVSEAQRDPAYRSAEVSRAVPLISSIPAIHDCVDDVLRCFIENSRKPVVIEGRTIAKYVYPKADVRLYIYADPIIRGMRRADALSTPDHVVSHVEMTKQLLQRDMMDETRAHKPTGFDETIHTKIDTSDHTTVDSTANAIRLIEETVPTIKQARLAMARVHALRTAKDHISAERKKGAGAERA